MKTAFIIAALLAFTASAWAAPSHNPRWTVYYNNELPASAFEPYDLIVFDSDSHPPIAPLQAGHKVVLGYVSLGEAESYRSYFQTLKEKNLLLKANPRWKGHRVIDVRKPGWQAYLIDTLIPSVLSQGFNGIMLDTSDSPLQAETDDPKHFAGMHEAVVRIVKAVHARFPAALIMLNRGFPVLPEVAGDIHMEMAESIYSDWQPGEKKPVLLSAQENQGYVDILKKAQKQAPGLKVYTIDYWPLSDKQGIRRIYETQRRQGFIPYVSSLNLQTLYPEP